MKVRKLPNGNVVLEDDAGDLIVSVTSNMCVHVDKQHANHLIISPNPNIENANTTVDALKIDVTEVTETEVGGVVTAFAGNRNDLFTILSESFFLPSTSSGGGGATGLAVTQAEKNLWNAQAPEEQTVDFVALTPKVITAASKTYISDVIAWLSNGEKTDFAVIRNSDTQVTITMLDSYTNVKIILI